MIKFSTITRKYRKYIIWGIGIILLLFVIVISFSIAPTDFPSGKIVSVKKDMTVSEVATLLDQEGIVRSTLFYKAYVVLLHDGKGVKMGDYLFDRPQSALRIAYRTAYGIQGLEKIKITVREGMTASSISQLLAKNIKGFDAKGFLDLVKKEEGYLFPETYYFNPNVTPFEVAHDMKSVFDNKIATIKKEIDAFNKPLSDIIKMASIVEKEANNDEDRHIIAGILWKRIKEGMPLQVDPPFYYFLNKTSLQLTLADLKKESPYNLYLNKGLPPTPIANPGLDAILATVTPTDSPYYFYLSDKQGNMHYAKTHDGHLANKEKYLQ